jgi:hypothetical protein
VAPTSDNHPRAEAPPDERLVQYAWIAARLNDIGVSGENFADWTEANFGERLTRRDLDAHVMPLTPPSKQGRRRKRPGSAPRREGPTPALMDALRVDEKRLGLLTLLFELPNPRFVARPGLFEWLESQAGIKQVIELREDGDIVALGVVRTHEEAGHLKSLVQEQVAERGEEQGVRMRVIERESHAGAAGTWFQLAKRQAEDG